MECFKNLSHPCIQLYPRLIYPPVHTDPLNRDSLVGNLVTMATIGIVMLRADLGDDLQSRPLTTGGR